MSIRAIKYVVCHSSMARQPTCDNLKSNISLYHLNKVAQRLVIVSKQLDTLYVKVTTKEIKIKIKRQPTVMGRCYSLNHHYKQ